MTPLATTAADLDAGPLLLALYLLALALPFALARLGVILCAEDADCPCGLRCSEDADLGVVWCHA